MGGVPVRLLLAAIACSVIAAGIVAGPAYALSPSVETMSPSPLGETSATLRATVNPNGLATKAYFEYGTTTGYGTKTAEINVGSGSTPVEVSQPISGLTKNTTYHYRVVASNSSGTSQGADKAFKTIGPPEVLTLSAEPDASGEWATLNAYVLPNGQSTSYQFEYWTESGPTETAPIPAGSAGSGYTAAKVSTTVTGLSPKTEYSYRAIATNASGKANGNTVSFLSSKHPAVQPSEATGVSWGNATAEALINPNGLSTDYFVEYGTTTSYGSKTTSKELGAESKKIPVSQPLNGLSPGTLYHYRWVAENSAGTTVGEDQTVTTLDYATLSAVGGGQLKNGDPLKLLSSNLKIGLYSCTEAEINGEVEFNPTAIQRITGAKFQSGAKGCEGGSINIKYAWLGKKAHQWQYGIDASGDVVIQGELELKATVYNGVFKIAECEYSVYLSGAGEAGVVLEPTLTGETKLTKGSLCPGSEPVSGKFTITSEGKPVEANSWP